MVVVVAYLPPSLLQRDGEFVTLPILASGVIALRCIAHSCSEPPASHNTTQPLQSTTPLATHGLHNSRAGRTAASSNLTIPTATASE
jgi:hypothetical protein